MLTLDEILKRDPKSVPLEEYERAFKFLKVSRLPDAAEDRKHRYLTIYRFRVFVRSSIIPVVSTVIAVAIYYFLCYVVQLSNFIVNSKYISIFWPPALYSISASKVTPLVSSMPLGSSPDDILFYANSCGLASIVWLSWLLWRIYRDVTDIGNYAPSDNESGVTNLTAKVMGLSTFYLIVALCLFYVSSMGFATERSLYLASIYDGVLAYTTKKIFLISSGYWLLGFFSILLSITVRGSRRRPANGGLDE
ncbi:hypothetical protein LB534_27275 [Mesorhizobium sp. CA18]|uniref:hypothetical protein n=1 Tax=unclassified Mesorhizobium TaxID=325217 RepID=UPI001CCE97EE|nr:MULTISPECIES: hypothetical protein [unclassified Mesorhizobium]MBZ9737124.1 hypothetical protein [Mesorhizobium sp. CA9]MBZ9828997.1 hypothetical protein [Mesorhizobium sp. CA18]MBZ9834685.1 hypothetical protein [Mesorhizobium sp. CA2]MBZ9840489.1 hypothetical protein [Mesorhizobium sp. CA3]MBZ9880503.1 hypothetical protein [Mesorhizobium sp. Ca11]